MRTACDLRQHRIDVRGETCPVPGQSFPFPREPASFSSHLTAATRVSGLIQSCFPVSSAATFQSDLVASQIGTQR